MTKESLIKKYPNKKLVSLRVAPDSKDRKFTQIYCFYKTEISSTNKTHTIGGHYKDVAVYGVFYSNNPKFIGDFDEVFQGSSTYLGFLESNNLLLFNAVKSKIIDLQYKTPSLTAALTGIIRKFSPKLFIGKSSIESLLKDVGGRETVYKYNGVIVFKENGKFGIFDALNNHVVCPPIFEVADLSYYEGPTFRITKNSLKIQVHKKVLRYIESHELVKIIFMKSIGTYHISEYGTWSES